MKHHVELEHLKFPIGRFSCPLEIDSEHLEQWKATIRNFPQQLQEITKNLTVENLNWKYRPEGWTVKQVVHHLADSHINAIIRLKLSLTEDAPVIRPYEEALWAELNDGLNNDVSASLKIIEGVHQRWFQLLDSLNEKDWNRMYFHPQHQRLFSVKEGLGIYHWHCKHHLAHIHQALQYKGEF
ncbi:putative metal-dependent hydrolase [Flavobacterium sp. SM15]|uniref:YfiT family bacillithiol transferase n=1 Tax=Flavobacterium sp. SM15 TaxID=2908005 RepID=UPI001EDA5DF0|nr:putative metal-dependent hydrolase [Flavobacterium sp. SM15]MCG2610261.1 putative metal-dependent hydrolase [Flavobacterium sp. SM15]